MVTTSRNKLSAHARAIRSLSSKISSCLVLRARLCLDAHHSTSMPNCIKQSKQCHILVTVSTRPRGHGWKLLQKPHFKTFGENFFQHASQKNSSTSGSSQPFVSSVTLHSLQMPFTWPHRWVANS